ncbi:MAG: UPF0280 family protein [Deltaproteobacteria bacterium]|nr:UPF0280 family protein [Deltaproteobacteria bacterium]
MYERRFYREWAKRADLARFEVKIRESDLLFLCDRDLREEARREVARVRDELEAYVARDPVFLTTLEPHRVLPGAPAVAAWMAEVCEPWGVGPMAAVAGAVAEIAGRKLLESATTVIAENGGDVFARSDEPVRFALYAGEDSPFSDTLAFEVDAGEGVGVCTSSGVVGPSLSFGKADAVVTVASDAAFADAAATAIANRIKTAADVERVVAQEKERGALEALIACAGDRIGFFGEIEIGRK